MTTEQNLSTINDPDVDDDDIEVDDETGPDIDLTARVLSVVVADDHLILRDLVASSLTDAGMNVVGVAANGEEAIDLAVAHRPDLVLIDLSMPVLGGAAATRRIREQVPECRVVVLTMLDDIGSTREALQAGAVGFLAKGGTSTDEMIETLRTVASGTTALSQDLAAKILDAAKTSLPQSDLLSDRQVEILQLIAHNMTTKQVARELKITQKTVHNHLNAIYRRLDTQNLTHAVLSAVRLGIIRLY